MGYTIFALATFRIFFLLLTGFANLIMICLGVVFFMFLCLGFIEFLGSLGLYFSSIFFYLYFFEYFSLPFSFLRTPITNILVWLKISYISLMHCLFFRFSVFSSFLCFIVVIVHCHVFKVTNLFFHSVQYSDNTILFTLKFNSFFFFYLWVISESSYID